MRATRWIVVIALASSAPAAAEPTLTLEDAVQLALTRNERAAIADLGVVVADAGVRRARVAYLPVLNANGNDTVRPFDDGSRNSLQAQITVTQPLIEPSAWPLYAQAKEQLASEMAQAADDKRRLAFDAAKAFFQVQLATGVASAAQRKLETAKADLDQTDAQFRAQLVSSNDVTRAQVGVAGAQRELASDQAQLDAAWVSLAFVCNSAIPHALAPPTALLAQGQQPITDVDALVARARAHRPDLLARTHSARAAHDFAKEPRMRYLPTLAVQGQAVVNPSGTPSGHDVDATLSAVASWSIYDGGARTADARSRDANAAIADLETTQLVREIDADVRGAAFSLAGAQAALLAANDAADASRKSADETAILYHQGLAKAIELLDANDQRFLAEVNAAAALANVANAYLALRLALGDEPIDPSPAGGKP